MIPGLVAAVQHNYYVHMRHGLLIGTFLLSLFGAGTVAADQNDPRLDTLFAKLHDQEGVHGARMVEQMIWGVWLESDSATVSLLMNRGVEAMGERRFEAALEAFNTIVELAPDFAEGWNKRATLFYLMGRFQDSLSDVEKTLDLEPRHFGALSGLGLIYTQLDDEEHALEAYEQALAVNPHLPLARLEVERLRKKVRGNRI